MTSLLPESRRSQIVDELRLRGMLRVTELSRILGVAPATIRRDINLLADEGAIRRVHGGAAFDTEEPLESEHHHPDPVRPVTEGAHRLGMLVPSLDYYWPGVIQGAQDEALERDVRLMLRGSSYESTDDRAQVAHLLNGGVDGLILAPDTNSAGTHDLLAWLSNSGVPVVLVEREAFLAPGHTPLESVNTDHVTGAGSAVRHLASQGHHNVGLVTSLRSPHADEIRRGWEAAVADCKLNATLGEQIGRPEDQGMEAQLEALVANCQRSGTTALLVHADREAISIIQYCQRIGMTIPRDLSVIAYDDEVAALFSPPLTAVRPPRVSIGRAAVGLMVDRLKDPNRPTHRVLVSPRLSLRESVTAPPS